MKLLTSTMAAMALTLATIANVELFELKGGEVSLALGATNSEVLFAAGPNAPWVPDPSGEFVQTSTYEGPRNFTPNTSGFHNILGTKSLELNEPAQPHYVLVAEQFGPVGKLEAEAAGWVGFSDTSDGNGIIVHAVPGRLSKAEAASWLLTDSTLDGRIPSTVWLFSPEEWTAFVATIFG